LFIPLSKKELNNILRRFKQIKEIEQSDKDVTIEIRSLEKMYRKNEPPLLTYKVTC
jgi:hypothetical protein